MKTEVTSTAEMIALGQEIGRVLAGGEVIELVGDVGAGKTTLVKGIALGLAVDETVQSPTFTISQVYDCRDGLRLSHYDFYRLADAGIMSDEIDEMIHDTQTITIIEWSEAVAKVLPKDRMVVKITTTSESSRGLTFEARGENSTMLLERMQ